MGQIILCKTPVLECGNHYLTSDYGYRTLNGKRAFHNGVDLVARINGKNTTDDIIAFADGVVTIAKYSASAGYYVELDHGNGCYTRYLHQKKGSLKVKKGEVVKKGQILGYMGSTGNSTGAHLHFDVKIGGCYVDPKPYLQGDEEFPKPIERMITVREWQIFAIEDGFKFPKYGADGKWGAECEAVAKKAVCKKRITYKYRNLTKLVQKVVGVKQDGKFGNDTRNAVMLWQKNNGLTADGCVGINTWKKMLGVN